MAENNNNENLNEVERPTIAELKVRATGIKEETNAGANTAERVGGLMYDMIDVLDANMEQMAGDTLKEPLKTINAAGLGIPSNDKFLAYKNNVWTYADLSTIVSSVDWSNVTNKPDLNNLPYLANSTPYGAGLSSSDGAIYLKDQNGNVLAYADISSGGGGGTDANAVHYITSGLSAGNVKLPTADKSGGLWASDYGIGDNNSVFGGISKVGNNISFQNNINGGIFKFNKPVLIENETLTLEYNGKKVEFSTPSRNDTSKRLDIKTYTYNSGEEVYVQDTGGYIYLNGSAISGGGGSTKLQVGSTIVSPDSNGIITIGYAGGTTVSTGTNSITISSTSGSGGVSKLKVGNTDVLPDSNGAITFAGSGVSASGSTITITGGGGGWTPPSGTSTTLETDDITNDAVTAAKLNDDVAKSYLSISDVTNLGNTIMAATGFTAFTVKAKSNGTHIFYLSRIIRNTDSHSAGTYFYIRGSMTQYGIVNPICKLETNSVICAVGTLSGGYYKFLQFNEASGSTTSGIDETAASYSFNEMQTIEAAAVQAMNNIFGANTFNPGSGTGIPSDVDSINTIYYVNPPV